MNDHGEKAQSGKIKRLAIGTVGGVVVFVGLIAIPYPGPGWAIVFVGLAILASEFDWAQAVLDTLKTRYDAWHAWLSRQSKPIKILFFALTALVVIITVWLLNGYGYLNDLLHLNLNWVDSPLPFFS